MVAAFHEVSVGFANRFPTLGVPMVAAGCGAAAYPFLHVLGAHDARQRGCIGSIGVAIGKRLIEQRDLSLAKSVQVMVSLYLCSFRV